MAWGAYSVGPNGAVTWNHPLAQMSGGIGLGGDLVVLSGTTQPDDIQRIAILIKKGAGLDAATLSGTYHTVLLASANAPPPRYTTFVGTTEVDGAGTWTLGNGTLNRDGVITPQAGGGGGAPYSVAADGTLSLVGGIFQGGVSASGRVAVFAGGTSGGSPQLWFLYR